MKIAYIGQKNMPAGQGGVERHVEELASRLAKAGHEVTVYVRKAHMSKLRKRVGQVSIVSIPSIATKNLDAITYTFLASLHALTQGFDVVHYQGIGPSLLCFIPKWFSRAKVVSTFHSHDYHHAKWGVFAKAMLKLGALASVTIPDETIAVSRYIRNYCENQLGVTPTYIPNGISQVRYVAPKTIAKKYGLKKGGYILVVSRLVAHKGIHHLVDAYNMIKPDKKLVIVGGPAEGARDYAAYLTMLTAGNGNIIMTGELGGRELAEMYANAYLYVQPSFSEGLSVSVLEARAYGHAPLVSDILPNVEAIGGYGLTFKRGSVLDLARKLRSLLRNGKVLRKLGQESKTKVLRDYNWNDIAKEMGLVYEHLLADTKSVAERTKAQKIHG